MSIFLILKTSTILGTIAVILAIQDLILEETLIAPVIANALLYRKD